MPEILIIDCFDSFTYNIQHILDDLNGGHCTVIRYDRFDIEKQLDFDCVVLSPGPGLPFDYPLIDDFLKRFAGKKKILGVCLGLQSIVTHFGGRLRRLDSVKHGLSSELEFTGHSVLFKDLRSKMEIGHYHSWVADEIGFPESILRITSRNREGLIMSVENEEMNLYAVQFHPESVLSPNGNSIIANWLKA